MSFEGRAVMNHRETAFPYRNHYTTSARVVLGKKTNEAASPEQHLLTVF